MTKQLYLRLALTCGASCAINPVASALAQPDAAITRDELIVSATRTPNRLDEVGSSVTVILAEEIAARQYAFTADVLRDAPGVTIARNGAFGGVASARIRGASSGQTLVVIDGIVVNDPAAPQGGFNFANLDVVDIDRIEILRGPQSILYGADAIGGVISITTKSGQSSTQAFLEGGSFSTVRGGASLSAGGDDAYGRITISGITTDGVSRAAAGAEDDGFRSIAGSVKGGLSLNENWRTEITARYGDARAEIDGFPPPAFTLSDTQETEDTTDYAIAGRLLQDYAKFDGALTVSYNNIERRNLDGDFETFTADGDRVSADYLGAIELSDALRFIGGGEVERTSVIVSGVDESADNGAIFGMIELSPTPNLTLSAGGRRDEFSNFNGATTARVAAAWAAPGDIVLRGSWGQGFRAPTLFELNFDQFGTVPNPDLQPERANGFDVGIEKQFVTASDHDISLRATFFHTRVNDQIAFDFAGSGFFNIAETRLRGLELEGVWRPSDWFSAQLNYNLIDAIDRQTGLQLLRQPKHSGTAVVSISPIENLSLSTTVIVNGEENDTPAPNDSFVRVDFRASYAVSDRLELYGRVENVTDTDYQDVSGFGEPGIASFGGVRVRL
ncbi:MAG: TonB-dependent receptor [Pseudomonadota bacterium]